MTQALDRRRIIMNFTTPPAPDDLQGVLINIIENINDDLLPFIDDMDLIVDEFAARDVLDELEVESEFDLLALYRDTTEKMPGVVAKNADSARVLYVYRRPILDLWCDTGEDFVTLLRNVVISELAQANGFSDEEIELMCEAAAQAAALNDDML